MHGSEEATTLLSLSEVSTGSNAALETTGVHGFILQETTRLPQRRGGDPYLARLLDAPPEEADTATDGFLLSSWRGCLV
jgi:hypothetical protein